MQTELLLGLIKDGSTQPSVFELFVMDSMFVFSLPALQHVVRAISLSFGRDSEPQNLDLLLSIIQVAFDASYLLSDNSSSFVESLYGMRRVSDSSNSLSRLQQWISIAYLCTFPHILTRLRACMDWIVQYLAQIDPLDDELDLHSRWKTVLSWIHSVTIHSVRIFSYALLFLEKSEVVGQVVFRLLFTLNVTEHHHPLFALLRMKLVKKSAQNSSSLVSSGQRPQSNTALRVLFTMLYAIRALDFVTNSDFSADMLPAKLAEMGSDRLPSPPQPSPVAIGGIHPPIDPTHCALCQRTRRDPSAASSGYIFCFNCISEYVARHGKCPITFLPCQARNIIRLYEAGNDHQT